jgi:chemotaxis response regulator CheB
MDVSINQERMARDVIVVGASAGGIRPVIEVLSLLPEDLPAFIGVVIHRGADSTARRADVLGVKTKLTADGRGCLAGFPFVQLASDTNQLTLALR